MLKKIIILGVVTLIAVLGIATVSAAGGFDQFGYNYGANVFVGTGSSWCQGKFGLDKPTCDASMAPFQNDKLVMKWSKAWDDAVFGPDGIRENGDELPWATDAWVNNEWNGQVPGGSGISEIAKIIWVGPDPENSAYWRPGGYAIWGEFEVVMDHYICSSANALCPTDPWPAHAIPTGYGGP